MKQTNFKFFENFKFLCVHDFSSFLVIIQPTIRQTSHMATPECYTSVIPIPVWYRCSPGRNIGWLGVWEGMPMALYRMRDHFVLLHLLLYRIPDHCKVLQLSKNIASNHHRGTNRDITTVETTHPHNIPKSISSSWDWYLGFPRRH